MFYLLYGHRRGHFGSFFFKHHIHDIFKLNNQKACNLAHLPTYSNWRESVTLSPLGECNPPYLKGFLCVDYSHQLGHCLIWPALSDQVSSFCFPLEPYSSVQSALWWYRSASRSIFKVLGGLWDKMLFIRLFSKDITIRYAPWYIVIWCILRYIVILHTHFSTENVKSELIQKLLSTIRVILIHLITFYW